MNLSGGMKGLASSTRAFTRVDLVVVLSTVCLAGAVANPTLFSQTSPARMRADALVCADNLSQIGRAFQIWATDHGDRHPWLVSTNEGGLRGHPLAPNSYMNFSWVSNGMPNAKILVCPADTNTTRQARDFSTNPDGGFMHPNYRANALSYLISFHAQHHLPRSILSGDRNIEGTQESSCSLAPFGALGGTRLISRPPSGGAFVGQWAADIHWLKGNLLFSDGSVDLGGNELLAAALSMQDDNTSRIHVQFPR